MTDRTEKGAEHKLRPQPRPPLPQEQAEKRPRPMPGQVEKRGQRG